MRTLIALSLLAVFAFGCGSGKDGNPPGPEANSGKTYTKEDAMAAQPVRGGADAKSGD